MFAEYRLLGRFIDLHKFYDLSLLRRSAVVLIGL